MQAFWLVRHTTEDHLANIIPISPSAERKERIGKRGRSEQIRDPTEAARKELTGNLVVILENHLEEDQDQVRSSRIRVISSEGSLARIIKKVRAKTSLAVIDLQDVATRTDALARRESIRSPTVLVQISPAAHCIDFWVFHVSDRIMNKLALAHIL